MKVGDYGRTIHGQITKIKYKWEKLNISQRIIKVTVQCEDDELYDYPNEIKTSPNIIDLIEVGDYVNGYKITNVVNEEPCPSGKFVDIDCDKDSSDSYFFENDIKSIVTREQFSQMEYRIGE